MRENAFRSKKTKKEKSSAEQTFSNGRRGRSPGQEGGGAGRAAAPQWCSASSSGCSSPNRASPSRLSSYRGPSRRDTCKSRKSVRRFSSSSATCGATEEDKFGKRSLTSRRHLDALRLSLLDSTASRVSPPPPPTPSSSPSTCVCITLSGSQIVILTPFSSQVPREKEASGCRSGPGLGRGDPPGAHRRAPRVGEISRLRSLHVAQQHDAALVALPEHGDLPHGEEQAPESAAEEEA